MSNIVPNVEVTRTSLIVNGEGLRLEDTSPEYLKTVLDVGRVAILGGINAFHEKMQAQYPEYNDIHPPSISVMQLATNSRKTRALTRLGLSNGSSVHIDIDEIHPRHHSLWNTIANSKFAPEVRSNLAGDGEIGGVWLYLRDLD